MNMKKTAAVTAVLLIPITLIGAASLGAQTVVTTSVVNAMSAQDDDTDDGCTVTASDVTVNPQLAEALSNNENAAQLAEALLEGKGIDLKGLKFTRTMVAGIIGNFQVESGVTFARAEKKDGNNVGQLDHMSNDNADEWTKGGARGLGIAQWTWNPGRAGNLISVARSMNRNWYDAAPQLQLLVNELSGSYHAVFTALSKASSPSDATSVFMTRFESPATATLGQRQAAAEAAYKVLNDQNVGADEAAASSTGTVADGVYRDVSARVVRADDCSSDSGASDAAYGEVNGAPKAAGNYSWMCDSQGICNDGDAGRFYAHLEYGYQCVWYAWNRLAMIHGSDGWTWVKGDGGTIKDAVQGVVGWTVSDKPQPGDGISGKSTPLASGGQYGHVAVVEKVESDPSGWKIVISEGNYNGSASWNGYDTRTLTAAQLSGTDVRFFRNSAWK